MSILVIAPHADDEIIGVGGTLLKSKAAGQQVYVCVATRGMEPLFNASFMERLRRETMACHRFVGIDHTFFLEFPSVTLETRPRYEINSKLLDVILQVKPDEVYIPHIGDMQIDHQIVTMAAMVALRPKYNHVVKRIYAYETLSETGWNIPNVQNAFIPTVYEDISGFLDAKQKAMSYYASQLCDFPSARSLGAIEALAKYHGSTVNVKAAEAFSLIREIR